MNSKAHHNAILELHLAVILFGGTALFSKLIPLSATDITFLRAIIAAIILATVVKYQQQSLKLYNKKEYLIAIILGVIVSLHWFTYFKAIQVSTVAVGIIAFFTYPMMTVLIEPLFTKKNIDFKDTISAGVVLSGVYLLIPNTDIEKNYHILLGIVLGILSAALFTVRNIIHKKYFSLHSNPHAMFYQTLVASVFLLPFYLHNSSRGAIDSTSWALLLILGIFFTALPHVLLSSALSHLKAKTVSLVSCLQPLYSVVFALFILKEHITLNTIIGGTLVIATALFETYQHHKN